MRKTRPEPAPRDWRRNCTLLALVFGVVTGGLPACHGGSGAASGADASMPDGTDQISSQDGGGPHGGEDAVSTYLLTVAGGHGGGMYPAGATVHVWADVDPRRQYLAEWSGDAELLVDPHEWHTTLVMPARDVTLAANVETLSVDFVESRFTGATGRPKRLRAWIPAGAKALILFLHGTGGSSDFIEKTEARAVALVAIARGYAVLGTEAEEVVAGDLDGNGKIRWNGALREDNVDLANLDALVGELRTRGSLGPDTPLVALGMSNGGAFSVTLGAVGASSLASRFPNLRFAAVVSYCAEGRADAAQLTTTPTAWYMCAHDDNPEVDNDIARQRYATVSGRGVDAEFDEHQPSPLYEARFTRVQGVDAATSRAIAAELAVGGFVDEDAFFVTPIDAILQAVQASPEQFPALMGLTGSQVLEVRAQIEVMQAAHAMYSDWASRTVDFIDRHVR